MSADATDDRGQAPDDGVEDALTEESHDRGHLPGQYKAWCSKCKAVSESLRPAGR